MILVQVRDQEKLSLEKSMLLSLCMLLSKEKLSLEKSMLLSKENKRHQSLNGYAAVAEDGNDDADLLLVATNGTET